MDLAKYIAIYSQKTNIDKIVWFFSIFIAKTKGGASADLFPPSWGFVKRHVESAVDFHQ